MTLLTTSQTEVLHDQAMRMLQSNDAQTVVDFCNRNAEELVEALTEEEYRRLEAKGVEAYERLEAAKAEAEREAEEKNAQADAERRSKLASILAERGYDEAATAVEMPLDEADGQTLAWVVRVLKEAIPASEIYGWAKWTAWNVHNLANEMAKKKADISAAKLFATFANNVQRTEGVLDSIRNVPKGAQAGLIRTARANLERVKQFRFSGWALSAIERLMAENNNPVVEALRNDPELAASVAAQPERKRAVALLTAMEGRLEAMIDAEEAKIQERREYSAKKSAGQSSRQAERVGNGPQGRVDSKPALGSGKLGKRAQHDPHYRGRGGRG